MLSIIACIHLTLSTIACIHVTVMVAPSLPYILANKSEVLSEANFGEFIDVTSISRYRFLPDQIMDHFLFTAITPCFVVNISRISISLRNVQNKIEFVEVKR